MKKKIQIFAGVALGLVLLWVVFRDTNWSEVAAATRDVHWGWLLLSQVVIGFSFVARVWRWGYIVRTAQPVSFRHMFSATQIGFLGNFILPGRAGEVIRALALRRLTRIPFTKCFAFVALDRVTDLFGLIAIMFIAALAFRPQEAVNPTGVSLPEWASPLLQPGAIRAATLSTVVALLVVVGAFVMLYLNQRLMLRISDACFSFVSERLAVRVHGLLRDFAEGMHVFRSFGDMSKSILFSLCVWALFALSYVCAIKAFGLDVPWYSPFVTLALLSVVIALPGAPGFVGQFHVAITASLVLVQPDIDLDVAKAFAIVGHLVNVVPVALAGIFCLWLEKLGLTELSRESRHAGEGDGEGTA